MHRNDHLALQRIDRLVRRTPSHTLLSGSS